MTGAAASPASRTGWSVTVLLVVAVGGAAGSCLRAGLHELVQDPGPFPWTTLSINLSGCAALALLPAIDAVRRHELLAPMLGTGLLGGYTTMSFWSAETHHLVTSGRPWLAAAYVVLTLVGCLGLVALVERLSTPDERAEFDAEEGDL